MIQKKAKDLKPLNEGETIVMKPQTLGNKVWKRGIIINGKGRSYNIETKWQIIDEKEQSLFQESAG